MSPPPPRLVVRLAGATLVLARVLACAGAEPQPTPIAAPPGGGGPARDIARAGAAWLASLDDGERRRALYDFGDAERFDLHLAPLFLEGLRGDRMDEARWQGVRSLLAAGLSDAGLAKVETVMGLEVEVERRDREVGGLRSLLRFIRDPRRYYVALFGVPREDAPFGVRVEGHHLSLNWTVVPGGEVSVTPFFLGSEPRELPFGSLRAGLRALPEEEDQARALYRSLTPAQRERATLPLTLARRFLGAERPLFVGEGRQVAPPTPVGVARADLDPAQRDALDALIHLYLATFAAPIAEARWAAIRAAGLDPIRFAWAGSEAPDQPSYYRVQGPGFLIEFDDTVPEADHVHAIYREFEGDFGRDLLREHYARAHVGSAIARLPWPGKSMPGPVGPWSRTAFSLPWHRVRHTGAGRPGPRPAPATRGFRFPLPVPPD